MFNLHLESKYFLKLAKSSISIVMKNIVVPIDFSEDSLKGIELALLFSGRHKTNIQLVYVQKKSSDYNSPGHFEEEKEWANTKFKELVAQYEPKLKNDSTLKYIIKSGKIYKEIVGQVESYTEGMVAASTHGASGFEEFFMGSNAFKIISATEKPVLNPARTASVRKVVSDPLPWPSRPSPWRGPLVRGLRSLDGILSLGVHHHRPNIAHSSRPV